MILPQSGSTVCSPTHFLPNMTSISPSSKLFILLYFPDTEASLQSDEVLQKNDLRALDSNSTRQSGMITHEGNLYLTFITNRVVNSDFQNLTFLDGGYLSSSLDIKKRSR